MIDELKPYPEYKDSGLPWLGRIPKHWDCLPHRAIFEEIKEQGHENEPLLSVTIGSGILRQEDLLADSSKKDSSNLNKSKYKLVEPGDIAYNKMRAWQGAVGVSKYCGIVSPAYIVQRLRGNLRPEYFHYLFRTPGFAKEAERWSYGITSDQWSLRPHHFKMIYSCMPPLDEQNLIVRFLHEIDRQVRRFISNRRRLIDKLTQRSVDFTRRVAESADTPYHRFEFIADQVLRKVEPVPTTEYTAVGLYNRGRGMFHKPSTLGSDLGDSEFYWIKENDFILSGQFAWEGAVALAEKQDEGCVASHRYPILRGKPEIAESSYLLAFFRTPLGQLLLNCNSRGAAGRNRPLNLRALLKEKIPVPSLPTQHEIAQLLISERLLRRSAERAIDLIREYRTRLISDVVTGKVDVQHLAPPPGSEDLEETVKELEPLDDAAGELNGEALAGEVDHAV